MNTVKIKTVNYIRTGYDRDDITRKEYISAILLFDDQKRVVREEHFNSDNEQENVLENSYEDDLLMTSSQFDGQGNRIVDTKNVYDANKLLVEKQTYYGEYDSAEIFRYEYEGKLLRKEILIEDADDDQNGVVVKEYFYDSERVAKRVEYDEDGNVQYVYCFDYDAQDRVIQTVVDEVMAKDRRTYVFDYDESGRKVKELTYNYGESLIAKKYFVYTEEGEILEEEFEDLDNYRKTVYEYAEKKLTKIAILDKSGSVQSWSDIRYDEQNRLFASADYIIDEVNPEDFRLLMETYRIYE
ncbi:MAG: hypothetical protein MJZ76_03575 [Bacteroidales bacterium]|nr:hypothetical protein [Bacteroidales bacterium]